MALTTDEKKTTGLTESAGSGTSETTASPAIYGGSYDNQLSDLYSNITGQKAFSYDADNDALFQQYKDRYTQNARKSMKDTMGQAASLTGGYDSSYGQNVGQQAYDTTMQGLTDMIPTLQDSAYQKYKDQYERLQTNYSLLNSMAAQEASTKASNYNNLSNLIASYGYSPTDDELSAAGMSSDQAKSILGTWAFNAYSNGQITADGYKAATGSYPPGYSTGSTGGGYGSGTTAKKTTTNANSSTYTSVASAMNEAGGYDNYLQQLASAVNDGSMKKTDAYAAANRAYIMAGKSAEYLSLN